jgi:hypothetical protein
MIISRADLTFALTDSSTRADVRYDAVLFFIWLAARLRDVGPEPGQAVWTCDRWTSSTTLDGVLVLHSWVSPVCFLLIMHGMEKTSFPLPDLFANLPTGIISQVDDRAC